jgi:hypothetical protein
VLEGVERRDRRLPGAPGVEITTSRSGPAIALAIRRWNGSIPSPQVAAKLSKLMPGV